MMSLPKAQPLSKAHSRRAFFGDAPLVDRYLRHWRRPVLANTPQRFSGWMMAWYGYMGPS